MIGGKGAASEAMENSMKKAKTSHTNPKIENNTYPAENTKGIKTGLPLHRIFSS